MIDLTKLSASGRAYSGARPWTTEEAEGLASIERERGVERLLAASYVRNGILTVEDYDAAVKAKFVPLTPEQALLAIETSLKNNKFATDLEKLAKEKTKAEAKASKAEEVKK